MLDSASRVAVHTTHAGAATATAIAHSHCSIIRFFFFFFSTAAVGACSSPLAPLGSPPSGEEQPSVFLVGGCGVWGAGVISLRTLRAARCALREPSAHHLSQTHICCPSSSPRQALQTVRLVPHHLYRLSHSPKRTSKACRSPQGRLRERAGVFLFCLCRCLCVTPLAPRFNVMIRM